MCVGVCVDVGVYECVCMRGGVCVCVGGGVHGCVGVLSIRKDIKGE